MPSRQEMQRSRWKFGVAIFVALLAVGGLVLLVSGEANLLRPGRSTVRAYFKNSTGLKVGSPVDLDGVTIGNVRAIHIVSHPAQTPVEVILAINGKYRSDLLTDSRANIRTMGVLGSTAVDIDNRQAHGQTMGSNGVVQTGGAPSMGAVLQSFQATNQKLSTTLEQANKLLGKISSSQGSIGKVINDATLRKRAAKAVDAFSSIQADVSAGHGTIGKLMTDHSLRNHLKDMQGRVSDIMASIKDGRGTAGKFIKDPALRKNLKEASKRLHEISSEVHSGQGAVGMMAHNADFKEKLQDTKSQVHTLTAEVKAGKGTLGEAMKNPSLENNLHTLVGKSRKLLTGLRKHPFKDVAIRFRIF